VTDAELAIARAASPTTAKAFFERGLILYERGKADEAIADFDRACARP
jgi:hypothetical protein